MSQSGGSPGRTSGSRFEDVERRVSHATVEQRGRRRAGLVNHRSAPDVDDDQTPGCTFASTSSLSSPSVWRGAGQRDDDAVVVADRLGEPIGVQHPAHPVDLHVTTRRGRRRARRAPRACVPSHDRCARGRRSARDEPASWRGTCPRSVGHRCCSPCCSRHPAELLQAREQTERGGFPRAATSCTPAVVVNRMRSSCSSVRCAPLTCAPPPASMVCTHRRSGFAPTVRAEHRRPLVGDAVEDLAGIDEFGRTRPADPRCARTTDRPRGRPGSAWAAAGRLLDHEIDPRVRVRGHHRGGLLGDRRGSYSPDALGHGVVVAHDLILVDRQPRTLARVSGAYRVGSAEQNPNLFWEQNVSDKRTDRDRQHRRGRAGRHGLEPRPQPREPRATPSPCTTARPEAHRRLMKEHGDRPASSPSEDDRGVLRVPHCRSRAPRSSWSRPEGAPTPSSRSWPTSSRRATSSSTAATPTSTTRSAASTSSRRRSSTSSAPASRAARRARQGPVDHAGRLEGGVETLGPILKSIAAVAEGEPCVTHIGTDGAGHFVKMIHNGIEYADMQLIAESYDLLRRIGGHEPDAIAKVFEEWNKGELESYLIEITSEVLKQKDAKTGKPFVDLIVDQAGSKGTGVWTVQNSVGLGVPVGGIAEAVFARAVSSKPEQRRPQKTSRPKPPRPGGREGFEDDVHAALYASKMVAYAQGFDAIIAGAKEYGWEIDKGAVAKIWRGGCIIRAQFLNRIVDAYEEHATSRRSSKTSTSPKRSPTAKTHGVGSCRTRRSRASRSPDSRLLSRTTTRRVGAPAGQPHPGPAGLFGAHTYRRIDNDARSTPSGRTTARRSRPSPRPTGAPPMELILCRRRGAANIAASEAERTGALRVEVPARDPDVAAPTGPPPGGGPRPPARRRGGARRGVGVAVPRGPLDGLHRPRGQRLERAGSGSTSGCGTGSSASSTPSPAAACGSCIPTRPPAAPSSASTTTGRRAASQWVDVALRVRSVLPDLTASGDRILVVAHDAVIHLFRAICEWIDEQALLEGAAGSPSRTPRSRDSSATSRPARGARRS